MKKGFLIVLILFMFSTPALAQSDKWQRDLFQILTEIEENQSEILKRLDQIEQNNSDTQQALKELKKNQKSYVNPKWTP